jgi:hypothetical protein
MTGIFWLDCVITLAVIGPITYWGLSRTHQHIMDDNKWYGPE